MSDPLRKPDHAPESYSPKETPEILKLAGEIKAIQPIIKPAPAAIKAKARDAVRIIELPACKMVWSGNCFGSSETNRNEKLRRFAEWWNAQDELRRDRFYTRDFMWHNLEAQSFAWGLAITEIPEDTGGWEVMDFPGGLYAVANYADGSHGEGEAIWKIIEKWVQKSGCFCLDVGADRHVMWHCFNPEGVPAVMGYGQCDQYVPIRVKEANEK